MNAVPDEPGQSVLDLCFFVIVEWPSRHVHARYFDSRVEDAKQRVLERIKIVQPRRDPSVAVDLKVLKLILSLIHISRHAWTSAGRDRECEIGVEWDRMAATQLWSSDETLLAFRVHR